MDIDNNLILIESEDKTVCATSWRFKHYIIE